MERGLQCKTNVNTRQIESSDFPTLCSGCLGENPYIRMEKTPYGGTCKMCERPFTLFKWRPGRGGGYRKTEVCQTCSKIKNLCQTCILDLQFGLPSQLRDAVLSSTGNAVSDSNGCDANREYHVQQELQKLENGINSNEETANEKLIKIARGAAMNREQERVKLPTTVSKRAHEIAFGVIGLETVGVENAADQDPGDYLPPGIETKDQLLNLLAGRASEPIVETAGAPQESVAPRKVLPPRPAGPPPASAFKNKTSVCANG